jgi:hypothetical protein
LIRDPKLYSELDGRKFLQDCFAAEQKLLKSQLDLSSTSITHDGTMGDVNESHFITFLKNYLPKRYCVETGIAIDCTGKTSEQLDIVIYDNQYTPILLFQESHRYIPAEAIYAVFECKPTINKTYLEYSGKKAASVRALNRTSVPVPNIYGKAKAKELSPIIAGIIASKMGWKDGFGKAFTKTHMSLVGNNRLDCGLAVSGHYFDTFNESQSITIGPREQALVYFLFRLLRKLQEIATVPAADWNLYASVLSKDLTISK